MFRREPYSLNRDATVRRPVLTPPRLQAMIDSELEPGERVLWQGMPIPRFFTAASMGAFLFGIPWTAFAIFWTAGAAWGVSESGGPGLFSVFPLFGVPFILVGLGMLSSPIWAYRSARKTAYVITDRRALSFETGYRAITVRSFPPERLQDIYRREKPDASGDIVINRNAWRDSDGDRQTNEVGFMGIPHVRDVEEMLKALAAQARPAKE